MDDARAREGPEELEAGSFELIEAARAPLDGGDGRDRGAPVRRIRVS